MYTQIQPKQESGATKTKDHHYIESELNKQPIIAGFSDRIQSSFQLKTVSIFLKDSNSAMTFCISQTT